MRASDICMFKEAGKLTKEDVLQCLLGIGPLEAELYYLLLKKPMTVKEISRNQGKERSTVQKSLKTLLDLGIVFRKTVPGKNRGYQYVYEALPVQKLKETLKKNAKEWYSSVTKLINTV